MFAQRLWGLVTTFCLICSVVGTAAAQVSLDLSGAENKWFYGYYGQRGTRGFFGEYNVDASSTGGNFASLNAWVGNQDVGSLVTGTNAGVSSFSLAITPKYGNEWVILKARYTINSYNTSAAPGSVVPISPGQLTLWSVQVNSPLVDLRFGKEIFQKGCSLQFSNVRTMEYLMLERTFEVPDILGRLVDCGALPRGVMSWFNWQLWPRYKRGETPVEPEDQLYGDPETGKSRFTLRDEAQQKDPFFAESLKDSPEEIERKKSWPTDDDAYAWSYRAPGRLRIGLGFFPWEQPSPFNTSLWNSNDLGVNAVNNLIGLVAYSSSDLEFGVGCLRSNYHQGPELQTSTLERFSAPTFERYVTEGWGYLKYNNGLFFLNTELDWFNRMYRFQRSADGTFFGVPDNTDGSGSLFASKYWESWRYMAEAGVVLGPVVGRAFYAFLPGPDRRHGVLIDRQPFIQGPPQNDPQQAFGLFDPYSILLAYRFGAGVNSAAYLSDASVCAVKLDYALAANLIVEGSFLRAIRNSHGYAVGYVRPNVGGNFGTVTYAEPPGSTFTNPAPSVPDRDLGWEAMAGVVWQLLHGWAVAARVSYWQPGRWFNFACVDKSVPNWDIPSAANNWGIRPDRVIDPVVGFELQLGASY